MIISQASGFSWGKFPKKRKLQSSVIKMVLAITGYLILAMEKSEKSMVRMDSTLIE